MTVFLVLYIYSMGFVGYSIQSASGGPAIQIIDVGSMEACRKIGESVKRVSKKAIKKNDYGAVRVDFECVETKKGG